MDSFGDRVIRRMRDLGHPLCVGIDPYLDKIPALFRRGSMAAGLPESADSILEFGKSIVDVIAGRVAIIKPQVSLFECHGEHGWAALAQLVRHAHAAGLLVLLDAKRGDIADTARPYAQTYLATNGAMKVDAMTVNPYMGPDCLEPFFAEANASGSGVVVLLRNSNPKSSVYQNAETSRGPFFTVVAESLVEAEETLTRGETGWSSLGVTVAATHAEDTNRIREILPRTLFLVLGYGAQGATAHEAVRGFVRGPAGLEGGMISSSRPVLFPGNSSQTDARKWETEVGDALSRAIDELSTAIA